MSVPDIVYAGRLRYALRFLGWALSRGMASYGSVAYAAPPPVWSHVPPRWWRREARHGLAACELFLSRQDPTDRSDSRENSTN